MAKPMKVDLSILKRLVQDLENGLDAAEKLKSTEGATMSDYVSEMSKAAGLASGIMQEGSLLVGDVMAMIRTSQQPAQPKSSDFLDKVLAGIKGNGGITN